MMRFTCKRVAALLCLSVAAVLLLVGTLNFDSFVNSMMESQIKKHLVLENGTDAFNNWVKPPVPVLFHIYVFDVVNSLEVLQTQAPPVVIEKGPYVYRLPVEKQDITFHANDTVSFRQPEAYIFAEDLSVGPETETFTSLNELFFIIANSVRHQPAMVQTAVSDLFEALGDEAFVTRSVGDIWWGYDDVALKEIKDLLERLHVNMTIPSKFGFNMDKNNTDGGIFNVYSGKSGNLDNFEVIDRWNGLRKLSVWNSDYANRIVGTDSSSQPPPLQKNKNLSFFDSHLQRTLNLIYTKPTQVKGVDAYHYAVPFSDFASAQENPENAGFCTPDVQHCLPSGAFNMSVLSQGVPLALSLPHFVGGDELYQRQVRGMRPSPEKHQPFFEYHPLTGVNMRSARRYQINMHIFPIQHFPAFSKIPDVFLPIIWIDGTGLIDDHTLDIFRNKIQATLEMLVYVKGAMVGVVCLLALVALGLALHWTRRDTQYRKRRQDERTGADDERLLPSDPHAINTVYDDYSHSPAVGT